jgi:CsoR family transcriptional regulator, copper-sensing transcriptional repressor
MKLRSEVAKEKLLNRLRRIEGQLRGVQTMVSDERDCREVLQQLSAIRSAVQGATLSVFEEFASDCLLDLEQHPTPDERAEMVRDLVELVGKTS